MRITEWIADNSSRNNNLVLQSDSNGRVDGIERKNKNKGKAFGIKYC